MPGCRFQRPVPAPKGGWEIDGWTAWRWIDGKTNPTRTRDIVLAARAYHEGLSGLRCDPALLGRDDPWAKADRVAWGEAPPSYSADYELLLRPFLSVAPAADRLQLVHADLTGNVVFAPGQPPGIIDPTLYWRPVAFAEAVVFVDQVWFSETIDLDPFADVPDLAAMVSRAAARRIVEQAEQVVLHGKDVSVALCTARRIADWTCAALDALGVRLRK
ncbi:MAG: hypothetical protein AAFY02_18345 [Pseudomonadota bacterium]